MSRYLETAKALQIWLAGLQVKPDFSDGHKISDRVDFQLNHPVDGKVTVSKKNLTEQIFTANGIALRGIKDGSSNKIEIVDAGGIYDPIDGRVQGEHYSTSHFALLSAILYNETKDDHYLDQAKQAVDFHLRTSPNEYAPISNWMYHWDFQNYAFVLTYGLLNDVLSTEDRKRWQNGLKTWKTNYKNKLTNWAAMRAWAFLERSRLFDGKLDVLKANWNLRIVHKARSSDGCFDDNLNLSRPIQYHIFTVAVLHRVYLLNRSEKLKERFIKGVRYFLPFVDPDGDFNYVGRGHEQIFGYGAAIYALEAAFKETGEDVFLTTADRLFDYLLKFRKGNYFPLVLNDRPDEERSGWYDYHHLTVYNAFLGVWLALAHLLKNERPPSALDENKPITWISEPTQTAIFSNENYFTAFYGGLEEYLSEAGVTPQHIWWKDIGFVYSCPGGPSLERFGEKSPPGSEQNILAPIAKNSTRWYVPANGKSEQFTQDGKSLRIQYNCGRFDLKRYVRFEKDAIVFDDEIIFLQAGEFADFRFFNFPVAFDKFEIEIESATRVILKSDRRSLCLEVKSCDVPFETLGIIHTAKGRMQLLVKRKQQFRAREGEKQHLQFTLRSNNE